MTLRTPDKEREYKDFLATGILEKRCPLCTNETIRSFRLWRIIENDFPYNKIASVHHMIVPLRHVNETGLSTEEKEELDEIKGSYLNDSYEYLVEPVRDMRSIPAHFHIHLIVSKE